MPTMHLSTFRCTLLGLTVIATGLLGVDCAITQGTITVGPNQTQLFFTDSGAPSGEYTTAFIVHGLSYNNGIFSKVQALAPVTKLRLVAVNRRDYHGSTPYSADELAVIANGTPSQKTAFMTARGVELATFIDQFMQQNRIPMPMKQGDTGSVSLISWSAGIMVSLSALANVEALSPDVQHRLAIRMRSFIVHEPSVETFGLPSFVQNYIPLIDTSVPANTTANLTAQFLSNYFDHGDLSAQNPFLLSWVVPSIIHAPSVYGLSKDQFNSIVELVPTGNDFAIIFNFAPQLNVNYHSAFFNATTRAFLPNMKVSSFSGTNTAAFGLFGRFVMQADNKAAGGGFINFAPLVNGVNHFIHWDFPSTAIVEYSTLVEY